MQKTLHTVFGYNRSYLCSTPITSTTRFYRLSKFVPTSKSSLTPKQTGNTSTTLRARASTNVVPRVCARIGIAYRRRALQTVLRGEKNENLRKHERGDQEEGNPEESRSVNQNGAAKSSKGARMKDIAERRITIQDPLTKMQGRMRVPTCERRIRNIMSHGTNELILTAMRLPTFQASRFAGNLPRSGGGVLNSAHICSAGSIPDWSFCRVLLSPLGGSL